MVNVWLIIIACVAPFLVLACSIYFLVYFSSPDDKYQAWIPKIVVVLGLSLAAYSILLLPLDVANQSTNGKMNLDLAWQILYGVVALFVVVIIPFCIFYYESEDPDKTFIYQIKWAVIFTIASIFICCLVVGILYAFIGTAEIPYKQVYAPLKDTASALPTCGDGSSIGADGTKCFMNRTISIRVSIVVYLIAILSLVGWVIFIVCGGCGMTALPVGCILSFIYRPRRLTLKDYSRLKNAINERAESLLEIGRELDQRQKSGKSRRKNRKMYNMFKQAVYKLEGEFKDLETAYKDQGGSPILHFFKLIFGFIFAIISFVWIIHIVLYMIIPNRPITPFLNTMFIALDGVFGLFGTTAYGIFAFYLLLAVIAGSVSLSSNFSYFAIHPLKVNDTMMNSFLFNTALILFAAITITQFVTLAFSSYARLTAVNALFRTYISNLRYIKWVFFVLPYAFLGAALLSIPLVFICWKRSDKAKQLDKLKAAAIEMK